MVIVLSVAGGLLVVFAFAIGYYWSKRSMKRKNTIYSRKIDLANLEAAMRKAVNENLSEAAKTLEKVALGWGENKGFPPAFFEEVEDVDLIARTLITCAKIHIQESKEKDPEHIYRGIGYFLIHAKIDKVKTMAILALVCNGDKVASKVVSSYLRAAYKFA